MKINTMTDLMHNPLLKIQYKYKLIKVKPMTLLLRCTEEVWQNKVLSFYNLQEKSLDKNQMVNLTDRPKISCPFGSNELINLLYLHEVTTWMGQHQWGSCVSLQ